jgi:hypothetical protein
MTHNRPNRSSTEPLIAQRKCFNRSKLRNELGIGLSLAGVNYKII